VQAKQLNLNHATLKIETLQTLLFIIEQDYQNFFKNDAFESMHQKFKDFATSIEQQAKNLSNPEMYYTFNNVFLQSNIDYSVLSLKLFNNNYQ